jgi:hypothetical protein
MPTQQLLDRVRELRDAGRTPKEIARALKMPPGAVAPIIRSLATAEGRTREDALIGCWISPGWSSSVQAADVCDLDVGHEPSATTGTGPLAWLSAQSSASSAIVSHPRWAGSRCAYPGYALTSVMVFDL